MLQKPMMIRHPFNSTKSHHTQFHRVVFFQPLSLAPPPGRTRNTLTHTHHHHRNITGIDDDDDDDESLPAIRLQFGERAGHRNYTSKRQPPPPTTTTTSFFALNSLQFGRHFGTPPTIAATKRNENVKRAAGTECSKNVKPELSLRRLS